MNLKHFQVPYLNSMSNDFHMKLKGGEMFFVFFCFGSCLAGFMKRRLQHFTKVFALVALVALLIVHFPISGTGYEHPVALMNVFHSIRSPFIHWLAQGLDPYCCRLVSWLLRWSGKQALTLHFHLD